MSDWEADVDDLDDIVHEFLVESHENLDQLDSDLVALEGAPGSRELLSSVFRTIHTIKGTSGFLAFSRLESLTHVGESLLVELRDGTRTIDQPTTDVLLRMVDKVRELLTRIEQSGAEGDVDVSDVVGALEAVLAGQAPAEQTVAPEAEAAPAEQAVAPKAAKAPAASRTRKIGARKAAAEPPSAAVLTVEEPRPAEVQEPAAPSGPAASARVAEVPRPHEPAEPINAGPDSEHASRTATETSIRVDLDLLDALMRQVSELVLARNAIARLANDGDVDLARASQRLSLIASELQEGVMKTRMQPIEHVWSKVPRMVRDLAAACGRQVRLDMVGGDTELDRSLLEAIKDPLTHLIRNAIDHGIEPPADRRASGKPAQGLLGLRAYHAGGQVVVEVIDDGKGVDTDAVAAKAVDKGLRTQAEVDQMPRPSCFRCSSCRGSPRLPR